MFDGGLAIVSGLIGGLAMAMLLYMGIAMMPSQMRMNLFRLLGTMMLPDGAMAYMAGAMMHAFMSIVFGVVHAAIYRAAGLESELAAWGLLFGAIHWLIVGMALGMMPMMHLGIRSRIIQAPGMFALGYPRMTAGWFLMLHLLFGVLVGVIYQVLI